MRTWFDKTAALFVAIAVMGFPVAARAIDTLTVLDNHINSWHLKKARRIADNLKKDERATPQAHYLMGKLLFHEGNISGGLEALRRAIEGARGELSWKALRDVVARADAVYISLKRQPGPSGRFVYRFADTRDALLIPYADDALTRQLNVLESIFGDRPEYPIEIDILPDVASLAAVTGLAHERIERTGTVGVTKYARIMIISPGSLNTGYPWLDALAHELTHFIITRVSKNRAPIWLHEGIAKLFERRWREDTVGTLTPEEAYLLDRAVKERRLIPLRRFHPSIAYLPDQEDAALAYAQVLSLTHYLSEKLGSDWTRRLLTSLSRGDSFERAFYLVSNSKFKRMYRWWHQAISGKRQTPVPAVSLMKRRFRRGATTGESGLESLLSTDVRRHLRVGDLLRLKGYTVAAVAEYREAQSIAESPSPEISDRLGACLLELDDPDAVIAMLPQMAGLYPAHATIYVQLGKAHLRKGNSAAAIAAFERANAINPFDPAVHCALKELYAGVGRADDAARETAHCTALAAGPV
ncbi:MAG: peptidase MA family metallohydrolase [Myxococcota bacterium]|nr:peptidase MA family metallohydrolase [Myxococcota bacterium]